MTDMDLFGKYISNTFAGTCNNSIIKRDPELISRGKVLYRVCAGGKFNYRFMFSNTVDSTFADGKNSKADMKGSEWTLISAFAGDGGTSPSGPCSGLTSVTFEGKATKTVNPGEMFWSDEIILDIPDGHYLAFEIIFKGEIIPYTPDKIIPCYIFENGEWKASREFPQPQLVGCDREVKRRVAFIGDSITQGLGTREDAYEFWAAQIGRGLGNEYGVWNLGLGYGRAHDAALNGVWLEKAKRAECVFVCFGVNDIFQIGDGELLKSDLLSIRDELHKAGCKVGVMTIPPFDMTGKALDIWYDVNDYIGEKLAVGADYFFDIAKVLGYPAPDRHKARYGGHPDGIGGAAVGRAFIARDFAL